MRATTHGTGTFRFHVLQRQPIRNATGLDGTGFAKHVTATQSHRTVQHVKADRTCEVLVHRTRAQLFVDLLVARYTVGSRTQVPSHARELGAQRRMQESAVLLVAFVAAVQVLLTAPQTRGLVVLLQDLTQSHGVDGSVFAELLRQLLILHGFLVELGRQLFLPEDLHAGELLLLQLQKLVVLVVQVTCVLVKVRRDFQHFLLEELEELLLYSDLRQEIFGSIQREIALGHRLELRRDQALVRLLEQRSFPCDRRIPAVALA
mmetsp:Transcript_2942/g.18504  ORF Transcript_2942/g.18504 Transcript_2942/m.18504 type:complete len:262 (+) Transcript_2942:236-1021(+)